MQKTIWLPNKKESLTLVNKKGQFVKEVTDFAGMYVKNEFYDNKENTPELSADIQITIKLKKKIGVLNLRNTNILILIAGEQISQFYIIPLIAGLLKQPTIKPV